MTTTIEKEAEQQTKRLKLVRIIGFSVIAVLILIATVVTIIHYVTETPQKEVVTRVSEADACQGFVKDKLKAPTTAEFGKSKTTINQNDGLHRVTGEVFSENSFGAKVRTYYVCEVQSTEDGWFPVSVEFAGQ